VTSKSEKSQQGISRRTVVKGTAWAVPAVVVATAAPAMAAGASQCLTASFEGVSCKQPGTGQNNFGFKLQICFTNTCSIEATIVVTQVQGNAASSPPLVLNPPLQIVVPPNSKACFDASQAVIYCSTNSNNFINVTFTVNGGPPQTQSVPSPPQNCATNPILCPKPA
jgi:hypothetical protein